MKDKIERAVRAFFEVLNTRSPERVSGLYSEDALHVTGSHGIVRGREEIARVYSDAFAYPPFAGRFECQSIECQIGAENASAAVAWTNGEINGYVSFLFAERSDWCLEIVHDMVAEPPPP